MRFGLFYIGQKSPEGYKAGGRKGGSSKSRHSILSRDLILCLCNYMWQRRILWLRHRIKRAYSDKLDWMFTSLFSVYNPLTFGVKKGWYFCLTDKIVCLTPLKYIQKFKIKWNLKHIQPYVRYQQTNEDVLSEHKFNTAWKKIKNYRNKWIQRVRLMDRDRLRHLIIKYLPCGKRSQGRPLRRLLPVNGTGSGHEA